MKASTESLGQSCGWRSDSWPQYWNQYMQPGFTESATRKFSSPIILNFRNVFLPLPPLEMKSHEPWVLVFCMSRVLGHLLKLNYSNGNRLWIFYRVMSGCEICGEKENIDLPNAYLVKRICLQWLPVFWSIGWFHKHPALFPIESAASLSHSNGVYMKKGL